MNYFSNLSALIELASTATLFHGTSAYNAVQVLKEGVFRLPLSETNASETTTSVIVNGKRTSQARSIPALYYLSTSRTLSSGYLADRSKNLSKVGQSVIFVIDTAKLRAKNRGIIIKPIDYWGMDANGRIYGSARESEERIYSNKYKLNIKGCISVLIYVRDPDWWQRQVFSFCLKHRIPVKLFTEDNFNGFLLQRQTNEDRNKAISLLKSAKRTNGYQTAHKGKLPYASKTAEKFYNKNKGMEKRISDFDALKMLVEKKSYNDLPYKVRSRFLERSWNDETLMQKFGNYLHNLRAENTRGSDEIEKVGNLVKQMKAKSLAQMFSKLSVKWEKLANEWREEEDRKWREEMKAKGQQIKSWDD